MRMCKEGLYVQIIDSIGTVRVCGWAGYYILGNLRDNSMEELFNSEKAIQFRKSLIEATYDFCNEENCPYMANNTLDSHIAEIGEMPKLPEIVSLAYDNRCNYSCTCCISKNNSKIDLEVREKVENEIRKILPYVKELSANGLGEFFVSDSMMQLVSEWNPEKIENASFVLETNGSLFNEKNWKKVENIGKAYLKVALTVHSFDEAAYQFLSGTTLKIDAIIDNLRFVKSLRDQGIINELEIATVVQERNFRMLPEFVQRCLDEFGADRVRVRRFLPEKAMDENIEWFFDVRNPMHPYHQEYLAVMQHPIFNDSRVFKWTGDHLSNRGDIPAKANYKVMRMLFLYDSMGKKLADWLMANGCSKIVLYAITDIARALIKVLKDQPIEIVYVYDRNSDLTNFEGYEVRKPLNENLKNTQYPILISLIARHNEIEESLRLHEYAGNILKLEAILDAICC